MRFLAYRPEKCASLNGRTGALNVQGAAIQPRTVPLRTYKIAPRASPGASKTHPGASWEPSMRPGGTRAESEGSQGRPRAPKRHSRSGQEASLGAQEAAKSGQEAATASQRAPKTCLQRRFRTILESQDCLQSAPKRILSPASIERAPEAPKHDPKLTRRHDRAHSNAPSRFNLAHSSRLKRVSSTRLSSRAPPRANRGDSAGSAGLAGLAGQKTYENL